MQDVRQWMQSTAGKVVSAVFSVAVIAVAVYLIITSLNEGKHEDDTSRMYIDIETGKPFRHEMVMGETSPVVSPFTGKNTGVRAEACYWTTDGGSKTQPTWVLLNQLAGKAGPTFCPDCGRLVVGHNPAPGEGVKVPPKQSEYQAYAASRRGADSREDER